MSKSVKKIWLGLIGEKGGGKDTVVKYLASHYQAKVLGVGDVVTELLNVLRLPVTRENLINLAEAIRGTFGENALQEGLLAKLQAAPNKLCIINGARKPAEIEQLKKLGAKIWYVTAPMELRFERLKQRRQKSDDKTQTFEQFRKQETLITEQFISELGKHANVIMTNTGTKQELLAITDHEIAKLIKE